VFYLDNKIGRF